MNLAFIVLIPFVGALLPLLAIRAGRNVCTAATAAVSALSLLILLAEGPAVYAGEIPKFAVEWLPQLGLSLSFFS